MLLNLPFVAEGLEFKPLTVVFVPTIERTDYLGSCLSFHQINRILHSELWIAEKDADTLVGFGFPIFESN